MKYGLRNSFTAVFLISLAIFATGIYASTADAKALCHATDSKSEPYNYIELSGSTGAEHLEALDSPLAGHEGDFVPLDSDCNKANDVVVEVQGQINPVPEPLAMLLFGTGLAGLGYASRRYFARDHSESGSEDR